MTAERRQSNRMLLLGLGVAALLVAAMWLHWPADSPAGLAALFDHAARWRTSPWAPCIVLAAFALGALVVFPVNLLIAATIVVLGPLAGGACALAGVTLSAAIVHEIGRAMPATSAARWFGLRGERLRRRIVGHGILAIALVRLLPVAPYSIVGFLSGVARVHRRDYLFGTVLGMTPGIVLYAIFIDRARAVLSAPHPLQWFGLAVAIAMVVAMAFGLRHWRMRRDCAR